MTGILVDIQKREIVPTLILEMVFPYRHLFEHIMGGRNISGWFSIVKWKTNHISYSIACTISDSDDRYFLEMNYVDES